MNILFEHIEKVRIDDISYGIHLCHTKFITLVHNARVLFLKKNQLSEDNCFGAGLMMLNINIDYRGQAFLDDAIKIQIRAVSHEKVKFTLHYTLFNETTEKLAAEVTTLMGFFDYQRQRLVRIPEGFLKLLQKGQ